MRLLSDRFWEKVNKRGPLLRTDLGRCWVWIGATRGGYGVIWMDQRNTLSHRVAFFLKYDHWPTPVCLHRCDNKLCVRPSHLSEGSQADNVRDAIKKGRWCWQNGTRSSSKLTVEMVREIKEDKRSQKEIAKAYGIHNSQVSRIKSGKIWGWIK